MNNFNKRLIFGILYVLLIVIATIYSKPFYLLLFFIFMNFSIYEFTKLLKLKSMLPYILGFVSFYTLNFLNNISTFEIKLASVIVLVLIFYPFIKALFTKSGIALSYLGNIFLTYIYIIIPFSVLLIIPIVNNVAIKTIDTRLTLGVFILIWSNDTFAYLVGRKFGKHKLFERISPKKTVEGFIGGLLFSIIASIILASYLIPDMAIFHWIAFALIVSVFGTIGDLIESMFKRQAKIKDSSNLIPGHGGFLDRLDSIIFAAPFILIYLILFL